MPCQSRQLDEYRMLGSQRLLFADQPLELLDWRNASQLRNRYPNPVEELLLARLCVARKPSSLEFLRTTLAAREKYEAEQAELERLRQAEILRQQQEREAQIAREAAEKATRETEEKARFEAERVQREKAEAEQREARLVAEKEAAELRAQHAAEAERKRIEAEQAAKLEAERQADEARQANQAHRKKICNEALKGLLALGIDEAKSKEILQAINKGLVPHVSIKF